jgi:nucleotide-binding universal stress UspA family protein
MESRDVAVAIDFSAPSMIALRWAERLAREAGSVVRPFHVIDTVGPGPGPRERLRPEQRAIVDALTADVLARWEDFRKDVPEAAGRELEVQVADRRGGLRRLLERCPAAVLVLGATGIGSPNVGIGSFAAAAVRDVPTDVLIVRDGHPLRWSGVVVGLDFSPSATRALDAAAAFAARDGVRLHLVHVVGPFFTESDSVGARLAEAVAAVRARHPGLETAAVIHRRVGTRAGLVEFSEKVGADLIAIGRRGAGGAHDFLLGSTAEHVLRDTQCAVWVAKPPRSG